uniref:Uncharacterized protein n=1 Tax=Syphacia muris TaxID=451379 RepID=A0A0N5AB82_9BILA
MTKCQTIQVRQYESLVGGKLILCSTSRQLKATRHTRNKRSGDCLRTTVPHVSETVPSRISRR